MTYSSPRLVLGTDERRKVDKESKEVAHGPSISVLSGDVLLSKIIPETEVHVRVI